MRNKRFSWKHAFVSLAISIVVCLPHRRCHGNRNETGASRIVPEILPAKTSVLIVLAAAIGFTNMRNP